MAKKAPFYARFELKTGIKPKRKGKTDTKNEKSNRNPAKLIPKTKNGNDGETKTSGTFVSCLGERLEPKLRNA